MQETLKKIQKKIAPTTLSDAVPKVLMALAKANDSQTSSKHLIFAAATLASVVDDFAAVEKEAVDTSANFGLGEDIADVSIHLGRALAAKNPKKHLLYATAVLISAIKDQE